MRHVCEVSILFAGIIPLDTAQLLDSPAEITLNEFEMGILSYVLFVFVGAVKYTVVS